MHRSLTRPLKPVAVLVATLLLFGLTAASADAGKKPKRVKSTITLEVTTSDMAKRIVIEQFEGDVGSKVKRCKSRRRVELTYMPGMGGGSQPFGEAMTNKKGHYEIAGNGVPPGRYVAKVLREKRGGVVCKGAKSEPVNRSPV